ncbi:MAG: hypothetical protein JNK11_12575 [Alphaproteobacteria bacterium]|nr:hypothetical protein [Alphaproteobacteria bacterium]
MSELFSSGAVIDLILAIMAIECVVVAIHYRRTGRGIGLADMLGNLLAGAGLLMALRASLTQAGWELVAAWLAIALVAHLADVYRRWRH